MSFTREARRGTPRRILINLVSSLILLQIVLYVTEFVARDKMGCRVSSVLRYYFIMTSLMWNAVEAINMYLMLIRVMDSGIRHFVLKAALIAWGR